MMMKSKQISNATCSHGDEAAKIIRKVPNGGRSEERNNRPGTEIVRE